MKKPERRVRPRAVREEEEMKPEYDFANGRRGEYASRYARGTNVILLDADVHAVFKDSRAVNEALRTLIRIRRGVPKPRDGPR